ncbi:TolC family protein [Pararobbsia alpina]|uniref:efflux transporter outer membrane subunit n=1 Tax=Pararobbsia alpina TaxID=621374 RepID=UPI0039A4A5AD
MRFEHSPTRPVRTWVTLAAAGVIAATSLYGCALGPDYARPDAPEHAERTFAESHDASFASTTTAANWWELYNDPVLTRLILQAFAHNPTIEVAKANLRLSRAQLDEAGAGRLPSIGTSAGYSRNRVGAENFNTSASQAAGGSGFAADHGDFNYYRAGFDASYEVDVFGRVSRSIEAARGDTQAAEAALDGARISIAAQVAQSYVDACGFADQADVARETAQIEANTEELTLRQLKSGRGTRRDVDQVTVLVEQANAQVPVLEGERRAQLYALAALTGVSPSDIDSEAAQCRDVPKVTQPIPVGDGAALLARRPDVRRAERKLAADTARIGVATAEFYPSVTLAGAASIGAPSFGNLGRGSSFSYSFGPLISWTFPNIEATRARIAESRAGADASLMEFRATMLAALEETEQALARYSAALDQNAALVRAAAAADDAANLSRVRFDAGRDSFLDLLVAEQDRATARRALATSDTSVADLQVSVFKALGGGWESEAGDDKTSTVTSSR